MFEGRLHGVFEGVFGWNSPTTGRIDEEHLQLGRRPILPCSGGREATARATAPFWLNRWLSSWAVRPRRGLEGSVLLEEPLGGRPQSKGGLEGMKRGL